MQREGPVVMGIGGGVHETMAGFVGDIAAIVRHLDSSYTQRVDS
jgi:hypothetical protein